jgi:CTP:molybdopterin cytidylyltransferase MocA
VRPVLVLIFHPAAPPDAGPLVRALAEARRSLAERQRVAFLAAGADEVQVVAGSPDGLSFGERLRAKVQACAKGRGAGGAVVLGSGSIPLARAADLRRFVEVAAGPGGRALANNRYSADVVAVSRAADLAELPPLPADNALPRWLEERAGVAVADLRSRWRLGVDIDTPLDLLILAAGGAGRGGDGVGAFHGTAPLIGERLAALAEVLTDRRGELLVAGRVSATTLRWLENGVACRVRALVEERGLRAASRLAQSGATTDSRPPRSVLGELLDRDGPESLARTVATLADAAVIDTRVLLAHRHGADESAWPPAEDRFASDLLLPASIADPWLRALTASAAGPSSISAPGIAVATFPSDRPILLGGHTLVNGGLRLLAQRARAGAR